MGEDQAGLEPVGDVAALAENRDIISIGAMADAVRRRLHGTRTTFVRVFEVHVDAVPGSLPSHLSAGEVRLVGRAHDLDAALAAVSAVRALAPQVPLTGFNLSDLPALDAEPANAARRLRDAGLDALAEVIVGEDDDPSLVASIRSAGLSVQRLTVRTLAGSPRDVVQRAADLQASAGGFRTFAPLPREISPAQPTTGYDDVRLVAMARLVATGIPSIQVDWKLYGPKLAQVALTMGADDVDGVAAHDPATLGARRSALAEITGNIRAASLEPVERDGRFDLVNAAI